MLPWFLRGSGALFASSKNCKNLELSPLPCKSLTFGYSICLCGIMCSSRGRVWGARMRVNSYVFGMNGCLSPQMGSSMYHGGLISFFKGCRSPHWGCRIHFRGGIIHHRGCRIQHRASYSSTGAVDSTTGAVEVSTGTVQSIIGAVQTPTGAA